MPVKRNLPSLKTHRDFATLADWLASSTPIAAQATRSRTMRSESSTVILPTGIDFTLPIDAAILEMRFAICHLNNAAAQLRS